MKNLSKIAAILVSIILSPIISGYTFSKLWNWFIVPITIADTLNIPMAIGVMLVFKILTFSYTDNDRKQIVGWTWNLFFKSLGQTVSLSLGMLITGYIVKQFV